jgi:hypothetical protein
VAEEAVLAVDLPVEDLAAEAVDSVEDLAVEAFRWFQRRLVKNRYYTIS